MELGKLWQIQPEINKEIREKLSQYSSIIAQLLYNRGIDNAIAAKEFFAHDWEMSAHDPFSFRNMREAVEMIINHLKAGHKIAIAGDYDADGVTSSALLKRTLQALGVQAEVWIPSRLGEGYGLSKKIVDQVLASSAKLLITVDNGIRAKNEVAYAKQKGLDVIVTDHHMGPDGDDYPDCLIIDPILEQETYPYKYLAGVGVAFKLMEALVKNSTLPEQQKNRLLTQVLDLVAIGTVADCVSLTCENRALVKRGLIEINKQLRPGMRSLITASGIKGEIDEWNIGWQLAPRLNVAGRLEHANTSYQLLVTDSQDEANKLSEKLSEKNATRQNETVRIVDYCELEVESSLKNDKLLILISPDLKGGEDKWMEGVIGLVAGRLCEKYARPVLVICKSEGQIKGSGRSVDGINIVEFLDNFRGLLARYGGHKMACGFTVKSQESLEKFVEAARNLANDSFQLTDMQPKIKVDMVLDLADINGQLVDQIDKFAPFGQGNPVPIFMSKDVRLMDLLPLGAEGQHRKLRFGSLWAIAFGAGKKWPDLTIGEQLDIVYSVDWNEYNGYKNLQLKIIDLKVSK